jgi:molybdopterin-containing oxidoreductase family iron-sulfur binding subunit
VVIQFTDAPADVDFTKAVKSAKNVIRLGYHGPSFDETSALVKSVGGTFIAASHYLESWSDGRTLDGTYVPVQPMIDPLFPTFSELDILAPFAGKNLEPYALVRETFNRLAKNNSDAAFSAWLAEGVLADSSSAAKKL